MGFWLLPRRGSPVIGVHVLLSPAPASASALLGLAGDIQVTHNTQVRILTCRAGAGGCQVNPVVPVLEVLPVFYSF
jgi:hypothetical protein